MRGQLRGAVATNGQTRSETYLRAVPRESTTALRKLRKELKVVLAGKIGLKPHTRNRVRSDCPETKWKGLPSQGTSLEWRALGGGCAVALAYKLPGEGATPSG